MPTRLYDAVLDRIGHGDLVRIRPAGLDIDEAVALFEQAPTNEEVLEACRAAYRQHSTAVDEATWGSVRAAQASDLKDNIAAMRGCDWNKGAERVALVTPVYDHPTLAAARQAVTADAFATFFVGIQANVDVFLGAEGEVGVGFPVTTNAAQGPLGFALGGWRLATTIDIGGNINTGMFLEPPAKVAGDFIGIELAAEPIEEGPELSFGIHMTTDLSKVVGFSLGVGVALSLIPVSGALVFGTIITSATT
jgi:hypothetical protein